MMKVADIFPSLSFDIFILFIYFFFTKHKGFWVVGLFFVLLIFFASNLSFFPFFES